MAPTLCTCLLLVLHAHYIYLIQFGQYLYSRFDRLNWTGTHHSSDFTVSNSLGLESYPNNIKIEVRDAVAAICLNSEDCIGRG